MKPTKSFGESFFLVLVFCVCIGKGVALWCYVCQQNNDPYCLDSPGRYGAYWCTDVQGLRCFTSWEKDKRGELVSFQRGCRTEWQIAGREGCWEDGYQGEGCVETCEEDKCNGGTLGYGTWEREPLFQIAGSEGEAVAKNKAATKSSPPQLSSIILLVIMMMHPH